MPRVLAYYDKVFPDSKPDDTFWLEVDRLDDELAAAFAQRPLSAMQTDQALKVFGEGFKKASAEAKKRAREAAPEGGT